MESMISSFFIQSTLLFSILFAGVWLIKQLFGKKLSAWLHYILWSVVVIKLLMPISFESELSPWNFISIAGIPSVQNEDTSTLPQSDSIKQLLNEYQSNEIINNSAAAPAPGHRDPGQSDGSNQTRKAGPSITKISWTQAVLYVWISGTAVFFIWLSVSALRIKRKIALSRWDNTPGWINEVFESCKKELGIKRNIRLVLQDSFPVPSIAGFVRPSLLLPGSIVSLPDEQQVRHIILHELIHYRHGDLIVTMLLNMLNAIYWFNPLVWIAFDLIRKDMEAVCDHSVLKNLGKNKRQDYIRTIVQFSGKNTGLKIRAAIPLSGSSVSMQDRIKRMFMSKKTKFRVKIPVFLLVCAITAAAFTTSCQPAPASPVAIGKLENITTKILVNGQADLLNGLPSTVKDSLTRENLTVNIDAAVQLPKAFRIPVVKVQPSGFDQEMTDRIIAALMQGNRIYEYSEIDSPTKSELKSQLVYIKELKAQGLETEINYDAIIAETEDAIKNAPDTVKRTSSDCKLKDVTEDGMMFGFTGKELAVTANLGRDYDAKLFIVSSQSGKMSSVWFTNEDLYCYYDIYDSFPAGTAEGMKMSLYDAKTLAIKTAQDMECELKLVDIRVAKAQQSPQNPKQAYVFWFTRQVNGIPSTYEANDCFEIVSQGENAGYAESYPFERMCMVVDDTGIAELQWNSPAKVTDTVSKNVKLKSFDDIIDIFKTRIFIQNAPQVNDNIRYAYDITQIETDSGETNIRQAAYNVDRITLGMMRISEKDNPEGYIMVPVWDFFGTEQVEFVSPAMDLYGNAKTLDTFDCSAKSFLTINAVDGSVIDRSSGAVV